MVTLVVDIEEDIGIVAAGEIEIQEAGAGHLGAVKIGAVQREFSGNELCTFAGSHAEDLGVDHGGVNGEVAVFAVGGDFNVVITQISFRKSALGDEGCNGGVNSAAQLLLGKGYGIGHIKRSPLL